MLKKIKSAIRNGAKSGFTTALKGDVKRYIVGLTHNSAGVKPEKLLSQFERFNGSFNNLNIGGWKDSETNETYVDVSTSYDNIESAIAIGRRYNQIAIFDYENLQEIRI